MNHKLFTVYHSSSAPLVTVICLCYNHERFVSEALQSVKNQTYTHIQLMVVDDKSSDESLHKIKAFTERYPDTQLIINEKNLGNCQSFNQALAFAKGKYIIDLSADDTLVNTKIENQVTLFESLDKSYGVIFSDAWHTDETGNIIKRHYENIYDIPSGDIYEEILAKYFICSPTMMIKKIVLDELGGYDETLAYEDFDFWVRSSRKWKYYFQDEITVRKRKLNHSLSTHFKKRRNTLQASTLKVCQKALLLNQTETENQALVKRLRYELRQSFRTQNFALVSEFAKMLKILHGADWMSKILTLIANFGFQIKK